MLDCEVKNKVKEMLSKLILTHIKKLSGLCNKIKKMLTDTVIFMDLEKILHMFNYKKCIGKAVA